MSDPEKQKEKYKEKYKEKLERYRNQTTTPQEKAEIEADLEKYQAITDYLLEEEAAVELPPPVGYETEYKKIAQAMRRRSRRMVLLVVVCTCVVMVALYVAMPTISRKIWYDPQTYTMSEFSSDLTCSIAVLAELTMPDIMMESVQVTPLGLGRYSIQVKQTQRIDPFTSNWVGGTITRGKIQMLPDFWQYPAVNSFWRASIGFAEEAPGPDRLILDCDTAKAILADLPEEYVLQAYVSLSEDWSMEQLAQVKETVMQEGTLGWVGVRCVAEEQQLLPLLGFQADSGGLIFDGVDARYPYYELSMHEDTSLAESWSRHFQALLQYSIDHAQDYARFTGDSTERLGTDIAPQAQAYIAQNGMQTYGFVYQATPKAVSALLEQDGVAGVYLTDTKIRIVRY